jgi:hypothetical protein
MSQTDPTESSSAPEPDPTWAEWMRKGEAAGILSRTPLMVPDWNAPPPLDMNADDLSRLVVRLRHSGEL